MPPPSTGARSGGSCCAAATSAASSCWPRRSRPGDAEAGLHLGLHHKRRGTWDEAVEVWERLAAEARSLAAVVELAKYLEHRRRDPAAALARVEEALSWGLPLGARERAELAKRRQRLERKAAHRTRSSG